MFFQTWLDSRSTFTFQIVLVFLWLHRYVRLIGNVVSHWSYKNYKIPEKPSYTSDNVTVIVPTIHNNFEELRESLQSILTCQPCELLLVTTTDKYAKLVKFAKSLEAPNIRTFHVPIANKRIQVCEAIPHVKTSLIIMADDDVTWPRTIMPWVLAPFENPKIGAVGTNQRVKRVRNGQISETLYNWLGACYIERRNFEISATHGIDGGTSCMSGRTCAFRAAILQCPFFLEGFKTERWRQYQLNADDDNFVTRWLVSHKWKTWVQYHKECEIETTLENNTKFLYQCARWARSNWRSNYTSLFIERHVLRQQWWSTYSLHVATFTSLAWLVDPIILLCVWKSGRDLPGNGQLHMLIAFLGFFVFSKFVKLFGLLLREPKDIIYWPISIAFGYFHGFIKIYALFTLNSTSWGSREDGDANDSERMSPRARRSESITTPPPHHAGLPRYQDEKTILITQTEIEMDNESDGNFNSDLSYDSAPPPIHASLPCRQDEKITLISPQIEIEVDSESDLDSDRRLNNSYDSDDSSISRSSSMVGVRGC